jgi:hypothetical protein
MIHEGPPDFGPRAFVYHGFDREGCAQASLRDASLWTSRNPWDKSHGYRQLSLRDHGSVCFQLKRKSWSWVASAINGKMAQNLGLVTMRRNLRIVALATTRR